MAKKKVTAPKTYDPGKGRPKEHLAYLNEREMAYLRSVNGNNMERGPRGLPSFPPADAMGSSSNAGSGGLRGAGSNYGSGSGRPGTSSNAGIGAGGQRGAGSNTGFGSGRPGTTSSAGTSGAGGQRGVTSGTQTGGSISPGGYRGPTSPMAGQGASFSSPVFALGANRDYVDRQRTAVADAKNALQSNSAVKGDLQVGGIRSLSVGPMSTPVNVYSPLSPVKSRVSVPSIAGPTIREDRPLPFGNLTADDLARRAVNLSTAEQELRDFLKYGPTPTPTGNPNMVGAALTRPSFGPVTPTGSPIQAGGVPTQSSMLPSFDLPMPMREYRPYDIVGAEQPYGVERTMRVDSLPPQNETIVEKTSVTEPAPVTAALQRPTYPAGTYTSPYDVPEIVASRIGTRKGLGLKGATTYGVTSYEPGDYEAYRASIDGYETPAVSAEDQPIEESPFRITAGRFYDKAKDKLANLVPDFLTAPGGAAGPAGENDRGEYRRFIPKADRESTTVAGGGKGKKEGGWPQQYYNWDVGVDIPSPGDSDYTLYLKYLKEKAAARAAV